jgi:predicted RNA-binding protein YlxR (DUF448 family)
MSEAVHSTSGEEQGGDVRPHGRARTCVGCGEHVRVDDATDLIRLVLGPSGEIAVDARGRHGADHGPQGGFGRGAHVHARPECLSRATRGGLLRVTKGKASAILDASGAAQPLGAEALGQAIAEAMTRRIEGLFATAVRAKQVARGPEAVLEACRSGAAALVLIAGDAADLANAPELAEIRGATEDGRAVTWGDKLRLARLVSWAEPDEAGVAVAAIAEPKLAQAVRQALQIIDACAGAGAVVPTGGGRGARRRGGRADDPASTARRAHAAGQGGAPARRNDVSRRGLSGVESNLERGE